MTTKKLMGALLAVAVFGGMGSEEIFSQGQAPALLLDLSVGSDGSIKKTGSSQCVVEQKEGLVLPDAKRIDIEKPDALVVPFLEGDPLFAAQQDFTWILKCQLGQSGAPYVVPLMGQWDARNNWRSAAIMSNGVAQSVGFNLSTDGTANTLFSLGSNSANYKQDSAVIIVVRLREGSELLLNVYDDKGNAEFDKKLVIPNSAEPFKTNAPFVFGAGGGTKMGFVRAQVWSSALSEAELFKALAAVK